MTAHGYPDHVWARAKEEAKELLTQVALDRLGLEYPNRI